MYAKRKRGLRGKYFIQLRLVPCTKIEGTDSPAELMCLTPSAFGNTSIVDKLEQVTTDDPKNNQCALDVLDPLLAIYPATRFLTGLPRSSAGEVMSAT